jgi:hypothetical protein
MLLWRSNAAFVVKQCRLASGRPERRALNAHPESCQDRSALDAVQRSGAPARRSPLTAGLTTSRCPAKRLEILLREPSDSETAATDFVLTVRQLSDRHLTPSCAVNFSGDVARLSAGQEYENGGDFSRLGSTPEDRLRAELFHLLLGQCRRDKRGPDRTRSYGVDPYTLLDRKAGKRPSEADDGRFGRSVGNEILCKCSGPWQGARFRAFSRGALSISSTSSEDCQKNRYGVIVVPNTATRAPKYSGVRAMLGTNVPWIAFDATIAYNSHPG